MSAPLISASRLIEASPDQVWAAVSDIQAMGGRSPQCRKMIIVHGQKHPGVGTLTVNLNRRGLLHWPTWAIVTAWEPSKLLEFRIPINGTRWRYELAEQSDGSTRLTESRIVHGNTSAASRLMVAAFLGGAKTFEAELGKGIEQTLAAIASEVANTPKAAR